MRWINVRWGYLSSLINSIPSHDNEGDLAFSGAYTGSNSDSRKPRCDSTLSRENNRSTFRSSLVKTHMNENIFNYVYSRVPFDTYRKYYTPHKCNSRMVSPWTSTLGSLVTSLGGVPTASRGRKRAKRSLLSKQACPPTNERVAILEVKQYLQR